MSEKTDALLDAFNSINDTYGEGTIMFLGQSTGIQIETVSSGFVGLDIALGKGWPVGRVIEVFGRESSGKTTLALNAIAKFQAAGKRAAFIDAEHALDPAYATRVGVDIADVAISQPNNGEDALNIVTQLIQTGKFGIIVIDSVAALTPKAELEGAIGDSHIGLQARMMSQALRMITPLAAQNNTTLVFINQTRQKINTGGYGNPETTSGGNALKFYASMRVEMRRTAQVKETSGDKETVGNGILVKVVKNKIAPPFKQVELEIRYEVGIDKQIDLLRTGLKLKVIEQAGAYYTILGNKHHGLENAREALADPKVGAEVEKIIRDSL